MFDSHRGQKILSLPRVVPCFPLLGLTRSGLFMGLRWLDRIFESRYRSTLSD